MTYKRKEQIGDATLYLGDCLEILPTLGRFDACITDPPYGISHPCNFAARGRGNLSACNDYPDVHMDNESFDPAPWLALDVPTLMWGANHFASRLPDSSGWLVWDKERPDELDQATCELAWTNFAKGVRRFRYLWNGMMKAGERGHNYHPTQKPVAVMEWALSLRWSPQGTILDPFMGSGSTLVACANLGRKSIGIEINEDYFNIAVERIRASDAQGRLFK